MATATEAVQTFRMIPLAHITPSPMNPRKRFDEKPLKELAESIKVHGVRQPILVRPDGRKTDRFEIVVGERRFRASKLAGKDEIPAMVDTLSNSEALEIMVIENLQREDVHPLDEALGYEALMKKSADSDPELGDLPGAPKHTAESIAAKVGKSVGYVYARLKLLGLIGAGREALESDRITPGHAVLIARLQPKDQVRAIAACFGSTDSYRLDHFKKELPEVIRFETITGEDPAGAFMRSLIPEKGLREWIQENINLKLKGVAWDLADDQLVPEAGACSLCPKRSMSNPSLFAELTKKGEDDTCFDPACFANKQKAFVKLQLKTAKSAEQPLVQISEQTAYTKPKEGEKILKRGQWLPAKKGECEGVTKALIVRGENAGEQQLVCADLNCKVHKRHLSSSGAGFTPEQNTRNREAEGAKRRIDDLVVEGVLAAAIAKIKKPDAKTLRTAIDIRLQHFYGDLTIPGKVLGLKVDKDPEVFLKTFTAFRKKAGLLELTRLLFMIAVADDFTIWASELKSIAKEYGVDMAKLRKQIEKAQTPEPAKKAKSK